MHIAICDDNIADRKQSERLLSRESDKRIHTTGNLYVDSYGNVEALLKSPQRYDLFFIDMTDLPPHGMEVAIQLREMGVTAPIVLLVSSINYRNYVNVPDLVYFIDKPVKVKELSDFLDTMAARFAEKVPTIELRDETKAHYALPDQVIYAYPDSHIMRVKLTDGTTVNQLGTINDLCRILSKFDNFVILNKKYIINLDHVMYIKKHTATMSDGTKLSIGLGERKSLTSMVLSRGSSRFLSEDLTDKNGDKHDDASDSLPEA